MPPDFDKFIYEVAPSQIKELFQLYFGIFHSFVQRQSQGQYKNMKVLNLKNAPSTNELLETLKQEFSNKYSYSFFGLDSEKSIIVRKSTFVGVQISKRGNEVSVQRLQNPSTSSTLFSVVDFLFTGGALIGIFYGSAIKNLEKETALFFKNKYE